jgi:hypothetical protein
MPAALRRITEPCVGSSSLAQAGRGRLSAHAQIHPKRSLLRWSDVPVLRRAADVREVCKQLVPHSLRIEEGDSPLPAWSVRWSECLVPQPEPIGVGLGTRQGFDSSTLPARVPAEFFDGNAGRHRTRREDLDTIREPGYSPRLDDLVISVRQSIDHCLMQRLPRGTPETGQSGTLENRPVVDRHLGH